MLVYLILFNIIHMLSITMAKRQNKAIHENKGDAYDPESYRPITLLKRKTNLLHVGRRNSYPPKRKSGGFQEGLLPKVNMEHIIHNDIYGFHCMLDRLSYMH